MKHILQGLVFTLVTIPIQASQSRLKEHAGAYPTQISIDPVQGNRPNPRDASIGLLSSGAHGYGMRSNSQSIMRAKTEEPECDEGYEAFKRDLLLLEAQEQDRTHESLRQEES